MSLVPSVLRALMAATMAELVYRLVSGGQVSSPAPRRGEPCGEGVAEREARLQGAPPPEPLKLYLRFPPQGEVGRGEVAGDWRGEPPPRAQEASEDGPLGETQGDCQGEVAGELS